MEETGQRDARPLSRREIDELVRESLRQEVAAARVRTPASPSSPARPATRRSNPLVRLLAVLVVVSAVLVGWQHRAPARGTDESLPSRPTTYADGSYAFLKMQPNDPTLPVGYNPCLKIPVVVNYADGPPDILTTLQEAIRTINQVSGLHLVYAGASQLRRRSQALDSGTILVSFNTADNDNALDGAAGVGGSASYTEGLPGVVQYYIGGMVTLNTLINDYDHAEQLLVIEHELGHAVGLAHSEGAEIMNANPWPFHLRQLQHGDLTGLARLGQLPCQ